MAITKVINDAVNLNQASDYSGLRLPVGTTGDIEETFTTDYLVVGGGGGSGTISGAGGAGGLRTSYNNSTTTTNSLSFPSGKTAIATYMLNNNANDISGNYNGTENNITYAQGKYGGGAIFNGSSSYIDTNISTITSNAGSVSLWVKTTTGTQSAFFGGQSPSTNRFYFGVRNSNFWMGAGNTQNSYNISASSLLDGNWHHVVLTLDGSTAKYYLDGNSTPVDTISYTSGGTIGVTPLIGALDLTGTVGSYTNGSIDQVRIYNSELSAQDITNIYTNEVQANSGGGVAAETSLTLTAGVAYDVTVGAGGTGVNLTSGNNGANSIFSTITSLGGGFGGLYDGSAYVTPGNGGSGGGGSLTNSLTRGNGTLNQGYEGGYGDNSGPPYSTGGGGGAASPGQNSPGGNTGGTGGAGLEVNIIGGSGNYYAGGGGGAGQTTGASGGIGGGGDGSGSSNGGENGAFNTGGGAGGWRAYSRGFNGGSGVVILRYPTADVSSFTTTGTLNTPSTTDTLASATYPATNTAYYKLDGNATDSSGNGYNGIASNLTWQNGRFGQAAVFNGSSSFIQTSLSLNSNNASISFWAKADTLGTSRPIYMINNRNGILVSYAYGSGSNSLTANTANQNTLINSTTWTSEYNHIVVNMTGFASSYSLGNFGSAVNVEVFLNGISIGTTTQDPYGQSDGCRIGRSNGTLYFDGDIDQVRIFETALSDSQVTELYNEHYQTKFTDGSDTAIVFTEGTGTVTFSGINPVPPQGALRTNTSYSEDGSASVIEHYNGTDWKRFDAIKYCTTNTLNFPSGAGCIASYNLDNNVNDIGNTYNGVNSNVTFNASGKFGAAAVFNGTSSKIELPSALSDGSTTATGCISFWFNVGAEVTSSTPSNEIMQFAGTSSLTGKIALGSTSGHMSGETFSVTYNVSGVYTYSTTNIPAGWNHAVVQWNSSDGKWDIYINSVKHTTYTVGTNAQGYFKLKFGNRSSAYYTGSLDQVRIFNDSLTSDEVSKLYNNEIACS